MADSSSELGELSISLCYNPTDQKLTVKLNYARALQPITKDGKLSKYFLWDVKFEHRMAMELGMEFMRSTKSETDVIERSYL